MASNLEFMEQGSPEPENVVSAVIPGAAVYMPLEDLVDAEKETARLIKEKERLISEVSRSESKLGNKGFTDKAPKAVVEEEMKKAGEYRAMLEKIENQLKGFKL
jgi:valyl-tRNA synthetase